MSDDAVNHFKPAYRAGFPDASTAARQPMFKETGMILALPLVFMAAVVLQPWIDPADLLRDPLAVAELKPAECCKVYYGAVSNLGVLLWTAGAAIALFGAGLALALGRPAGEAGLLLAAGMLTGFLAIDDLFLVHENVLPAFGVPGRCESRRSM